MLQTIFSLFSTFSEDIKNYCVSLSKMNKLVIINFLGFKKKKKSCILTLECLRSNIYTLFFQVFSHTYIQPILQIFIYTYASFFLNVSSCFLGLNIKDNRNWVKYLLMLQISNKSPGSFYFTNALRNSVIESEPGTLT